MLPSEDSRFIYLLRGNAPLFILGLLSEKSRERDAAAGNSGGFPRPSALTPPAAAVYNALI
jgi:hypothetical protein